MQRDLVEARAMHDHRPLDAERAQHLGDRLDQPFLGDAEQLHLRLGRVHAGAEDVHDRAHLERAAHRPGMFEAGMVGRREEEAEADLVQRPARGRRRNVEPDAQLLQHVGRAAFAR